MAKKRLCTVCGEECKDRGKECEFCHEFICGGCLVVGPKGSACIRCSKDPKIREKIGYYFKD